MEPTRILRGVPRLDHLLARNLGITRSDARALVEEGRVAAADAPLADPRQNVVDLPFAVTVDEDEHLLHDVAHVALHKPVGVVTAMRDDLHPTAYGLVEAAPLADELRPVGRLDLDTSGLLLWTTDGTFLQRLTHPKRAVPRRYHAALARPFQAPPADLVLEDGHRPSIAALHTIAAADAHPALARPREAKVWAEVTLTGGAYHEVRRIFAALGSHVLALCRVAYGRYELPRDLPAGEFRLIAPGDVL